MIRTASPPTPARSTIVPSSEGLGPREEVPALGAIGDVLNLALRITNGDVPESHADGLGSHAA